MANAGVQGVDGVSRAGKHSSSSLIFDDAPVDVTNEVNFIWSIANKLRGTYRSDKYKDVIIPMTIIRRFECALEPTKAAVIAKHQSNPHSPRQVLEKISGFQFYNWSPFTLARLLDDSANLADNLRSYINGFSKNVLDMLMSSYNGLKFGEQIEKMDRNNRLFGVVKDFSELDLNPTTIDSVKMGYIFEELIRRFSENAEAGDHYTGRDIVKTMVSILLAEGCDDFSDDGKVITVLDQACGTGGMLSTAQNFIHRLNPTADVRLFGQENNDESYAICLAEMLIKGQRAENIRYQDTMKADCFPETKMRFVIENPPFGQPWGGKDAAEGVEAAVKAENAKGVSGRFGAGLPGAGDMQMLFLQSAVDKMDDELGRCAIIHNGSPLFSGGVASGESQIRRYLLEQDLIEAIIALPTDLFYNTGIATYIWVLSKNKDERRKGKVQLIDARHLCHKLRKSLGNKRNEISADDRAEITRLYAEFSEGKYCKIIDAQDFLYREYTVMQPLQRSYGISESRIDGLRSSDALKNVYDGATVAKLQASEELSAKDEKKLAKLLAGLPAYDAIFACLDARQSDDVYMTKESFMPVLEEVLSEDALIDAYAQQDESTSLREAVADRDEAIAFSLDKKLLERIAHGLSVMDKNAEIQTDRKGNILWDKDTKDTEIVPLPRDIDDYMQAEVLPHVPDARAFFEEDLSKKKPVVKTGAEIPFTRYFYEYKQPEPSADLAMEFMDLEQSVQARIANLFGDGTDSRHCERSEAISPRAGD